MPEPCELLNEADIRGVIGKEHEEMEPGPGTLLPTTSRTENDNCWRRFRRPDDADNSLPWLREIQVDVTLYHSYSDKSGVYWAKTGYRFKRDLFKHVDRAHVENLGDVASTWYETDLFLGAHTLFRDSNLVVEVIYSGSDPLPPDDAKRGALQLARAVAENL